MNQNPKNTRQNRIRSIKRIAVFSAVFLSGSASLAYELIFVRLALLVYGSSVMAVSIVTACFLGGLGIGAFLYSRYIPGRSISPAKLYGILQSAICLSSILSFFTLTLFGIRTAGFFSDYIVAVFCITVPPILMGAAFPAAVSLLRDRTGHVSQHHLVFIYTVETAGGIAGILLSAFLLIGSIGVRGTFLSASGVNAFIGILFLLLRTGKESRRETGRQTPPLSFHISLIAYLSGFAALCYEIVWARTLSLYLYNNIYGFAIVLSGFLSGITIGSVCAFLSARKTKSLNSFWISQLLLAVTASLFIPGIRLSYIMMKMTGFTTAGMITAGFFSSALPVVFSGFAFSSLLRYANESDEDSDRSAGYVYAFNTAGGVTGSLAAGLFLIPLIGSTATILCAACINTAVAVKGARLSGFSKSPVLLSVLAVCVLIGISGSYKAVPPAVEDILSDGGTLLFRKETGGGTVTVAKASRPENLKVCFVDQNSVISNLYDNLKTVALLGHLSFALKEDVQNCFVIGFGTGVTVRSILSHPVKHVLCAEICSGVLECEKYFSELNTGVLEDRRLSIEINDGRRLLRTLENRIDAIICDPVHPRLGSSNLYTRDFYTLCRNRLSENGVLLQYLPFHDMPPETFDSVLRTFTEVFPNSSLWLGASHGILAGIAGDTPPDFSDVEQLFEDPNVRADLKKSLIPDIRTLAGCFICSGKELKAFSRNAAVNTDLFPSVEFSGVGPADWTEEENMMRISPAAVKMSDYFSSVPAASADSLSRVPRSVYHKLRGRALQRAGLPEQALEQLELAEQFNPDDIEIRIFRYEISGNR